MDASALLKSQGWRGSGHSLHKTDDSIGLAKPILVSRKNNTLGIGRKNHVTSDQWWLNAFDEQLKSLDTSNKTSVVQTKENTKLGGLLTVGSGKYSGANALYACFVSGGLLQGTVKSNTKDESTDTTPEAEVAPHVRKETKEERRARKEEKRRRKAEREAKRQRKADKLAKKLAKKTASLGALTSVKGKDESKKAKKSTEKKNKSGKTGAAPETREERRARKVAKRKGKENKEKRHKVEEG
ncbi:Protein PXR1 [Cytospora mali]|uniref:Protein PXR1 n=1 Tax=Cytospora mali TaxID=578113 RepID=A0A194W430_CYTMA|nr:Protein PXR1 [Valsa mali]